MPQFGLRTIGRIEEASPDVDLHDLPPLPWTLSRAEVVQATFEVDLDAASLRRSCAYDDRRRRGRTSASTRAMSCGVVTFRFARRPG